ncbi:MAG: ABC transporter ATP-binding protein [Alphaproteobacteria bacterium]|nr:ABC transporter ATP-binding protein [Alphaproteobacteria bacterium]
MLLKLLPFLRPYRLSFAWALLQVFVMVGFNLLKPWPLQLVIDDVLGGKRVTLEPLAGLSTATLLIVACIGLVVVNLGAGLIEFAHNRTTIAVGQNMVNDLRGALYAQLQRLSLAFHNRQRVGDLMHRITADAFAVQTMLMNGMLPILSAMILLAGMLAVLFPLDARLTLVSLLVVPALFALIGAFNRKIGDVATEVRERETLVYSLVQWAMQSIKIVQAFTQEEGEYRRFMGASEASLGATLRLYGWQTLYSAAVNGLVAAGTAGVVYVGARSVLAGELTLGQLVVFISYLAQLYAPVNQLTQSWGLIAGAHVGAARCFEILEVEADLVDGTHAFPLAGAKGDVEWRGVSFGYHRELPVLHQIDLRVAAGTKVAIVGPSGAGKSTLLSLLPRFFDPATGSVLVDGVDLREYTLKSLRRQIAMVLQPPLIFPMSVRANIAYGRPEATDAEVEEAARLARVHDVIARLPQGYDTVLGDTAMLSEGEKQRLTIARAILRDSPILVLDEPTSALDVETEALVMAGLERLTRGRTTFIIAHRLSTVRTADHIVVLKNGVIAEEGSFATLIAKSGTFAELYSAQFFDTPKAAMRTA